MSQFKMNFNNKDLTCEVNKFAKQADGSVMIKYGNICVLVTACERKSNEKRGFFPLTVNYEEKLYAAGSIPGNYKRREGQPSEQATLSARLIDRPIRPLFPEGYCNEVQVICDVLATDKTEEEDVYATIGASLALMLAKDIPFEGPIACVNIGLIDGEFVCNPTYEQLESSDLQLKIAGSYDAINMVEASCNEVSEEVMVDALLYGHEEIKKLIEWQNEVLKELNVVKEEYIEEIDEEYEVIFKLVQTNYSSDIKKILMEPDREQRGQLFRDLKDKILEQHCEDELLTNYYNMSVDKVIKNVFRELIIVDKYRVDQRTTDELRKLTSEIDLLPMVHASAMFTRGETQVLNVLTLGLKSDAQTFDGLENEETRRFMLHYNFPPFSVGETGRIGSPGRREIGHGTLARKALLPVLPTETEFPYTIRLVGEVLESNGSSSQATICSGSLALMAGGVPIKKQVAGIAMGLIANEDDYTILTDIQGLEDHLGDMDFKVAGTKDGITAIQMDIKIKGVSKEILSKSLEQAHSARLKVLENMNEIISEPREHVSENVVKLESFKIDEKKIKDVIGRGGEMINKIIDQTNVKIDIEENGEVFIYSHDQEMIEKAKEIILDIAKVYKVKDKYEAVVVRVEEYGAFVKFDKNTEALLHISDLSDKRTEKVTDVINLNDKIEVEIKEIDKKNRIKVKLITKE